MSEFLSGLLLGLLVLLVMRRRWINAAERELARAREAGEEAGALVMFASGLIAVARKSVGRDAVAARVADLLTVAVGATSSACFTVDADGSLSRVAVGGSYPPQVAPDAEFETKAAAVAASMGPERVVIGRGAVGSAAQSRTVVSTPDEPGRPAQLAIPVFDGERLLGVVSVAGPLAGGSFAPRTIALAKRLVAGAAPVLANAS